MSLSSSLPLLPAILQDIIFNFLIAYFEVKRSTQERKRDGFCLRPGKRLLFRGRHGSEVCAYYG